MLPLEDIPKDLCRSLKGVFSDIDDTITTDGSLSGAAYSAIEELSSSGIKFVPITGRPAGWCDMIARFWPVDGVIGENGAFYFAYDRKNKKMIRRFMQDEKERLKGRMKLEVIGKKILSKVQGSAIASDQFSRISDLAIDFCEDVPALSSEKIDKIAEIFRAEGATAKISSIHVNAWFGNYSKLEMTKIFVREILKLDLDQDKNSFIFCGDSPNDEPLFQYFPSSLGVANVRDFISSLTYLPTYISTSRGGEGFVEICDKLLDKKIKSPESA